MHWFNRGDCNPLKTNNTAPISGKLSRDYQAENFKKISGSWQRPFNGRSTAVQRLGAPWAHVGRKAGAGNRLVPLVFSAWATQPRRSGNVRKALDATLVAFPLVLEWVKGHAGVLGNERADELSLLGIREVLERARDPLTERFAQIMEAS